MNKERRKMIAQAVEKAQDLALQIEQLAEQIQEIADQEQDARDNLPESLQDGDQGERMQEAIDALDYAKSDLEGFDLDNIVQQLEAAAA